ncbi:MAG TPA: transglutaminase domain-containing protein, partial [Nitrospira sp.]|nr:transglutaminase domain-containing protein [Nitrospira sp.]
MGVSLVRNVPQWNWDGDHIVHECIVPSSRSVVGYTRGHTYNIDVREFLVTSRNEVMHQTLNNTIKKFASKRDDGWDFFQSRDRGSFDFRAAIVMDFVHTAIAYSNGRAGDPWQFPDETLEVREGDCEDRALLMASLLLASGISSYNVRVVLGKMRLRKPNGRFTDRDHVWVMYKNEAGKWHVLEPLLSKKRRPTRWTDKDQFTPLSAEYIPYFLFNDSHLWQIYHAENAEPVHRFCLKRNWSALHPRFAGIVHKSIIGEALEIPECPANVRDRLLSYFSFGYLGIPVVDNYDRDFSDYDPADHFDNSQIRAGWKKVNQRLETF